jgi:CheY-like chemotaxis protein/AraC-like DNA-binding protein
MTLESAGYAVLEAENGAMGIDMAREHIPDLVISDVMMPEKDGFELTATLKQDALTSHIPIVLLTAKGRLESKIAGYEAGADAYLPKPFYTEELLVRLRQLLEVRRVLQQKYAVPGNAAPPDVPVAHDEATLPPHDAALVARVHAYIREHLREEDFSIEGLAGELAMSRSQLYRKVAALTGLSPARLIREHRLEAAHELLISRPELMVAEVGLMVGIQSEHHFRTLFRERYGCTPQEARTRRDVP